MGQDLFGRLPIAVRLAELASAVPTTTSRVVALSGAPGSGKSSVLQMVSEIVAAEPELATVALDAQTYGSAATLMTGLATELSKLFRELGVIKEADRVRDALISYGGVVSGVIRLAGVKVDVAGALERSAASLRTEIANDLERASKRLIIVIDHLDYLSRDDVGEALAALRMYAEIPYVAIMLAVDRHALARASAATGSAAHAFERLVHTEILMPPADPHVLSRVMIGGLERVAARVGRSFERVFALFEPPAGVGLALIETPRDAKRAINALSAALPLLASDADAYLASLEIVVRVLVPELDRSRLVTRSRARDHQALLRELTASLADSPRASAAEEALRILLAD